MGGMYLKSLGIWASFSYGPPRFGEIVRRLRVNGPQHALRSRPDPDVDLAPERSVMPISDDASLFPDL